MHSLKLYRARGSPFPALIGISGQNGNPLLLRQQLQQPPLPLALASRTKGRLSSSYTSVNASEISHFDALASTWWDAHGPSRLLHLMNPPRHAFIRTCLANTTTTTTNAGPGLLPLGSPPTTAMKYLDVGCGGGIFAESAARLADVEGVLGIDASEEVLAVARRHARRDPGLAGKLEYRRSSVEKLAAAMAADKGQRDGRFDLVSVFEVVEHVDDPYRFLDNCAALVKPGGWLVLSTIARTWISWFTTNLMAEDVLRIVPRGTHTWEKYVNDEELTSYFASRGGWNTPMVQGVVYVPGFGWKEVQGSEKMGNYFFGVRKDGP